MSINGLREGKDKDGDYFLSGKFAIYQEGTIRTKTESQIKNKF